MKASQLSPRISIDREKIEVFRKKWKIVELSLFGSVIRDDFRMDSDIDVLVERAKDAHWSVFDHMKVEEELSAILGRKVDLVSKRAVERSPNALRRKTILGTAQRFYVS